MNIQLCLLFTGKPNIFVFGILLFHGINFQMSPIFYSYHNMLIACVLFISGSILPSSRRTKCPTTLALQWPTTAGHHSAFTQYGSKHYSSVLVLVMEVYEKSHLIYHVKLLDPSASLEPKI